MKTSSRRLCKTSSRRLEDVLEDVKLLRWRRVEDVFKTSWRQTNVCWATDNNLFVPTQYQIFDYKCCVKSLLRFLNSNIAGGSIDKRLNYLLGILFFGFLKIQVILKGKVVNFILLAFFNLLISYSYSLHNLNRSGFLKDNSSFKLITQSIKFHR